MSSPYKIVGMQRKFIKFFFLCFAFLLTQKGHTEAESYKKAQNFFLQSQKATTNYLKSGRGLENHKPSTEIAIKNEPYNQSSYQVPEQPNQSNSKLSTKAIFFSVLSQTINDDNMDSPDYGLSAAISIPVYSNLMFLNSEFQFSGDVKNAGAWGQVQFLQKEAIRLARFSETNMELFFGMGFGYGHGTEFTANQRFFAPWATGLQWSKINVPERVFYRFELGWTGDFYFLSNNYSQGLLANLSLGYKL